MEVEVIKADESLKSRPANSVGKLRVAAYCRVSTDEEDQVKSYNSMVQYYTDFISKNPEWKMVKVYADKGMTGTKAENRVEFQNLITDCLAGKIDMIVAKSLSRFARNTLDTLKYVRMLKERNIAIFFEVENINTLKDGEFLMTILSSVAQQEVENTSSYVKKGLKMKMKRGELVGFNRCLGYRYDKETKQIYIDEEEAEIVREIFETYITGIGGQVLAKRLNEKGYRTVKGNKWNADNIIGVIKNEKYKGDLLMGKTYTTDPITKRRIANNGEEDKFYVRDHHEAIVPRELFDAANAIREKRSTSKARVKTYGKRQKYSRQYTFSSKLICGFCGSVLSRRVWHSSSEYTTNIWACMTRTKTGMNNCKHSKGVAEYLIEKAFVDAYNKTFVDCSKARAELEKSIEESLKGDSAKTKLLKNTRKISDLRDMRRKIIDGYAAGTIDEDVYKMKDAEYKAQINALTAENDEIEQFVDEELIFHEKMELIKNFLKENQKMEEFDPVVFEACVEKVIVGGFNEDGSPDPYRVEFVFRPNDDDFTISDIKSKYAVRKKYDSSKRIKALCKNELSRDLKMCSNYVNGDNNLYSYSSADTCRDGGFTPKTECLKS